MQSENSSTIAPMPFVSEFNKRYGKKDIGTLRDEIRTRIGQKTTYAKLEEIYDVNRYYLWKIIHDPDYVPPLKVLMRLGIEIVVNIVVVFGEVPAGAQAVNGRYCECGQPFIPNHPARKRCFLCSPYKPHKRKEG